MLDHHKSQLLYAQLDRVDGESAGYLIQKIINLGAYNVQLVSSLTKKGRPGYILLIDLNEHIKVEIEELLVSEFNVTGWHYILTHHCHKKVENSQRELELIIDKNKMSNITIPFKLLNNNGSATVILEHDYCIELKERIKKLSGHVISLNKLKTRLKNTLLTDQLKVEL